MPESVSTSEHSVLGRKQTLLVNWCRWMESVVCLAPDGRSAYFGNGFNHWGVQTNQKAIAALGAGAACVDAGTGGRWRHLALQMLRYSLDTHVSGRADLMDGDRWGQTWISVLGLERMLHVVPELEGDMEPEDKAALRRVLLAEADWLTDEMKVEADKIAPNKPEVNLWSGCLLYRTAQLYPDAIRRIDYLEKAQRFLLNGISLDSDAESDRLYADRPLRDWHVGAQFFDSMALHHHAYLNIGYMVICLSQVALLHFACRQHHWTPPEALYLHADELWTVVRGMVFPDGRLIRIGGDTRTRYTYCQDYLPLVWRLAADLGWDGLDPNLDSAWLSIMETEAAHNGNGSFFGRRLQDLGQGSWLYLARLEGDRASVLSTEVLWKDLFAVPQAEPVPQEAHSDEVAWTDTYHGAIMQRDSVRIASWTWRSAEPPQGLCLPLAHSNLAEWRQNMGGQIIGRGLRNLQVVESFDQAAFPGGFVTWGTTLHISELVPGEGNPSPLKMARQLTVAAALPDGRTLLVYQNCRSLIRDRVRSIKGLFLQIPNDIFNDCTRTYTTASGARQLRGAEGGVKQEVPINGNWINIDDVLSLVCSGPSDELRLRQSGRRQIEIKPNPHMSNQGLGGSLWVDEICSPCRTRDLQIEPGERLYENTFAVLAGIGADQTQAMASGLIRETHLAEDLLQISYAAPDAPTCRLFVNRGDEVRSWRFEESVGGTWGAIGSDSPGRCTLPPRSAGLAILT